MKLEKTSHLPRLPDNFEYLDILPYSWQEALTDFVLNKVPSEKVNRRTVYYKYMSSDGYIYCWDFDKAILLWLNDFGDFSPSNRTTEGLAELAFYKVAQLY